MYLKSMRPFSLFILAFGMLLVNCSNNYHDEIDRGEGYNYRPGYPELRLAATGLIDELGDSYIIVSGEVVEGSFVYTGKDDVLTADMTIEIQIMKEETREVIVRETYNESVSSKNQRVITSQDVKQFEYEYEASPGTYTIQVIITDKTSGKETIRTTKTTIPDTQDDQSYITEIRILTKDTSKPQNGFSQSTTYDIPSRFDSLKFVFQVTNNDPETPIEIESRLLKFRADDEPARMMHEVNYSPSSIAYRGIKYDDYEVIQSSTRMLDQPGSVVIELAFEDLERGNYRLEVTSNKNQQDEVFKGRAFGIKSTNYPSLKAPEELARPLYYLMSNKEYERLISIKDPDSLKQAIDRFWLSNIKNSKIAREIVSRYYQRVEEANKQFSNFKEGWKTDMGMMYILFGPPWYVNQYSDEMVWSYSYNVNDPEKNFFFKRNKRKTKYFPFDNYILQRSNHYYSLQYQQVEKWKSTLILRDRL